MRKKREIHGDASARLYSIWESMRYRCNNANHRSRKHYSGRGISVCKEWNSSYVVFKQWAESNGYDSSLTLDRIDVDGNYSPENCRWATKTQQCANSRKPMNGVTSRFKGVTWTERNSKWKAKIGFYGKQKHLGYFKSEVDAALAYDDAAIRIFGEFARPNFSRNAHINNTVGRK